MAIDLTKAPQQLKEATIEPAKSQILYNKLDSTIRVALAALDAGGEFALSTLVPDSSVGGAAANVALSQTTQELHSKLLSKAITNAIIEYLRENVTTQPTTTEPAPGPVVHPHIIKPIKLIVP